MRSIARTSATSSRCSALREREVDSKITVTDAEVDQYLATVKAQNAGETEYRLAHILVTVPEQASAEQIEHRRRRAEEALRAIKSGEDFAQVAAAFSDASDALAGRQSRLARRRAPADGVRRRGARA